MLTDLNCEDVSPAPCINTGTLIDIATGGFEQGHNGEWLLNGGLAPITGYVGRGGQYKTTLADYIIATTLKRYPEAEGWKHDVEQNAFNKARYDTFAGEEVSSRILLTNSAALSMSETISKIKEFMAYRLKHKKDLYRKTPFRDTKGNPKYAWIPFLISIDSFTLFRTDSEVLASMSDKSMEDSSRNMDDMTDGKVKRKLLFDFSRWAYQAGFNFLLPAQISDKAEINPYAPIKKQLQFLGNGDHIKGVGNQYTFLTNTVFQSTKPSPLLDSKKSPEYPSGSSSGADLNEVNMVVLRCKTNFAGSVIPLVVAQSSGVHSGLTNYHYLKKNNDFGFNVKGHNRYSLFLPEELLHRNTLADKLRENYELERGLEIMSQYCWMLNNWNINALDVNVPKSPEEFVKAINECSELKLSDILNSRGYWIFDGQKNDREYMSLFDIFDILKK